MSKMVVGDTQMECERDREAGREIPQRLIHQKADDDDRSQCLIGIQLWQRKFATPANQARLVSRLSKRRQHQQSFWQRTMSSWIKFCVIRSYVAVLMEQRLINWCVKSFSTYPMCCAEKKIISREKNGRHQNFWAVEKMKISQLKI